MEQELSKATQQHENNHAVHEVNINSETLDKMSTASSSDSSNVEYEPPQPTGVPGELSYHGGRIIKRVLQEGVGDELVPFGSKVFVHYVGKLENGQVFDSSRDRNEPFPFKIGTGQVIMGWDRGVATMKKSEKSLFVIKPEWAYGQAGSPPKIPANATLHFEIEVLYWEKFENVTADGGVLKDIIRQGSGYEKPHDGTTVTIKYVGRVKDGDVFDNKWENSEHKITIGTDPNMLWGFEAALRSMIKGEKSKFYIRSDYGYGDQSHDELKIPNNATLEYVIEMISWEKNKDSWQMQLEEKIEFGKGRKEHGNALFKLGQWKRAIDAYQKIIDLFRYDQNLSESHKSIVDQLKIAAHNNIATCQMKLKNHTEVITNCTIVLSIDSNNLKALIVRANIYLDRKDIELARSDLHRADDIAQHQNREVIRMMALCKKYTAQEQEKQKKLYAGLFDRVQLIPSEETEKKKKNKRQKKNHNTRSSAKTEEKETNE